MNISKIAKTGYLLAAIAVTPVMSIGMERGTCKPGQPTEQSYTWNFPREASGILNDVRAGATQVEDHADQLRSLSMNTSLNWQGQGDELISIKGKVNDMGAKLCRLEEIRAAVLPWQRKAIDQTAVLIQEMANNTKQAIQYLNKNEEHLWSSTSRPYATNLYNESRRLSQTIGNFEKLAKLRQEEKALHTALGTKSSA